MSTLTPRFRSKFSTQNKLWVNWLKLWNVLFIWMYLDTDNAMHYSDVNYRFYNSKQINNVPIYTKLSSIVVFLGYKFPLWHRSNPLCDWLAGSGWRGDLLTWRCPSPRPVPTAARARPPWAASRTPSPLPEPSPPGATAPAPYERSARAEWERQADMTSHRQTWRHTGQQSVVTGDVFLHSGPDTRYYTDRYHRQHNHVFLQLAKPRGYYCFAL